MSNRTTIATRQDNGHAAKHNQQQGNEPPEGHSTASWFLWRHMRSLYGGRWEREYTKTDETGAWGSMLSRFHPEQIKRAIVVCSKDHKDHPPNMGQFRELLEMQPDPNAPKRLPAPEQSDQDVSREWLQLLQGMLDEKSEQYRREPMSEAERQRHWDILGLNNDPKPGYFPAGAPGACHSGCGRPGTMALIHGSNWYCPKCYPGELWYRV